ncbi:hypothetical protein RN001_001419 [Aquatica leii]|uniref:SWIM-type domain-containing protein n=1 Tax=Aquatica leii TaxID=1421715 RepID=A0AAN7SQW8_9COLE|nr:hypothetical protein RN001_001419 [Aquatica leii]
MEAGFQKADTHNLPRVDIHMLYEFIKTTSSFSGVKAVRSGRENYGDSAVGYVQVKRDGDICIVRGRVCLEHKLRSKPYSIICKINENNNAIKDIKCLDCVASAGGCKHRIAFLMWLHRRSEEPASTSTICYWKKPVLAQVGSSIKFIKSVDIGRKSKKTLVDVNRVNDFAEEAFNLVKKQKYTCPISVHICIPTDVETLSLHNLMTAFVASDLEHTADNFIIFCNDSLTNENIASACALSHNQSENSLWFKLRYARMTASKLYDVAVCKTPNGSLVKQIMGVTKQFQTAAMKRGINLEKVIHELERQINCNIRSAGLQF